MVAFAQVLEEEFDKASAAIEVNIAVDMVNVKITCPSARWKNILRSSTGLMPLPELFYWHEREIGLVNFGNLIVVAETVGPWVQACGRGSRGSVGARFRYREHHSPIEHGCRREQGTYARKARNPGIFGFMGRFASKNRAHSHYFLTNCTLA